MLLLSIAGFSQDYPLEAVDIEQFIEEVFAVQNGDVSAEELYESLLLFYADPINLNNTDREELRALFILSEQQIANFFQYREKYGQLLTIYELQAIPGFDMATIYSLLPFVMVRDDGLAADNRPLWKRIISEENNYLLLRYEQTIEKKRGFSPVSEDDSSRYIGGPGKYYMRFRTSHPRDFSFGFTAEKDAGEKLAWQPGERRYGADFYSGHVQLQNQGRVKNIIVGDYQIQYGQSLLLGAGFNVGKGAETITTVRRSNLGIKPYTSVIETNFFRGAAATIKTGNHLDITGFYSHLQQDASLQTDTTTDINQYISSIQASGFHRTAREVASKDQISQQTFGGVVQYTSNNKRLQAGTILLFDKLSTPLLRADRPYNEFEFKGTDNFNTGLYYSYSWQNFSFFGEAARSKSGGFGGVTGIIASLSPTLESSVVLRKYDRDFHTFYGNAFGESTRNINETGWYWGLKYRPSRRYEFTAYFDSFHFPWLRPDINAPSNGYEYLFRANYRPNRGTLLYAQFREQVKGDDPSGQDSKITHPVNGIKRNYIFNMDYPAGDHISFKSRVQFSTYDHNGNHTTGYAAIQDLNIDYGRFRLSGRFALFATEDFNNAQYAYERDVLYAFSVPAYNGIGSRQYLLLQYKHSKKLTLWIRYARTHYKNEEYISTGLEQIKGNKKTDIKLQARIKF